MFYIVTEGSHLFDMAAECADDDHAKDALNKMHNSAMQVLSATFSLRLDWFPYVILFYVLLCDVHSISRLICACICFIEIVSTVSDSIASLIPWA